MVRTLLALFAVCLMVTPAVTQEATPEAEATNEAPGKLTLNPEGTYQGVQPGGNNLPPKAPKLPLRKGPQRLTWSGFQIKDGVPTVFLQVTGMPDYRVEEGKGSVVVTLKNTTVPVKNNRRPLKVEAFNTSVQEVAATPKGRDTRVTIRTKDAERPTHKERIEAAAGGFQLLVIELPK